MKVQVDANKWANVCEFGDRIVRARALGWVIRGVLDSGDNLFEVTNPEGRYCGTVNAAPSGDHNECMLRLDDWGVPE